MNPEHFKKWASDPSFEAKSTSISQSDYFEAQFSTSSHKTMKMYTNSRFKSLSVPLSAAFVAVALWLYRTNYLSCLRTYASQLVTVAAPSSLRSHMHTATPTPKHEPRIEVPSDHFTHTNKPGMVLDGRGMQSAQLVNNK
ncbi:hypothetical protein H2248_004371 [Termitomyces sp. 'cryptogamus']|nr:hypothetical protein H2248_004371 [Termitomyces sp. 'cryptogamus']